MFGREHFNIFSLSFLFFRCFKFLVENNGVQLNVAREWREREREREREGERARARASERERARERRT